MIYFISTDSLNAPIKIGYARDVEQRLKTLQTGSPDEFYILACIEDGGLAVEERLHKMFAAGRMVGEWFRHDTPGLREFIRDVEFYDNWRWNVMEPAHQRVAAVVQRVSPYPWPELEDFEFLLDDDEARIQLREARAERRAYERSLRQ